MKFITHPTKEIVECGAKLYKIKLENGENGKGKMELKQ